MKRKHGRDLFFIAALGAGLLFATVADASQHRHHHHHPVGHHGRHHAHAIFLRPQPASFIVDAQSGKVLESENADSPRYPASLTKMMTLYLTFENLKSGRMHLKDTVPVSAHAASQAQTNIALQAGERIPVKDAILSIVVRSANDSAVALGEAIGGSEPAFAQMMTRKAHSLGMKHTFFHNANGLPDPQQHTTARDMAILGRALKHDFPQYFPFFSTESFSYHGLTYVTHNHVMTRYDGVDGIKTGYIRASGFNVVTSVNRDGHTLIAVVMGGPTARSRDDKMIGLLDHTFTRLASLEGRGTQLAQAERPISPKAYANDDALEGEGDKLTDDSVTPGNSFAPVQTGSALETLSPSGGQQASLGNGAWGIQVGSYAHSEEAVSAVSRAIKAAPAELGASTITVSDGNDKAAAHRARLVNLSQAQAESACRKLVAQQQSCFVYHAD